MCRIKTQRIVWGGNDEKKIRIAWRIWQILFIKKLLFFLSLVLFSGTGFFFKPENNIVPFSTICVCCLHRTQTKALFYFLLLFFPSHIVDLWLEYNKHAWQKKRNKSNKNLIFCFGSSTFFGDGHDKWI